MAELLDPTPNGTQIRKVELVWPHKDELVGPVQSADGTWSIRPTSSVKVLRGLTSIVAHGEPGEPTVGLVLSGDRLESLSLLGRSLRHSATLAFVDLPRIVVDDKDAAFRSETDETYSTWMSVVRALVKSVVPLLAREGVVVVVTSDDEQAFTRLICDELLGRMNHVATVVWQKRYAPLNMRGMKEFTVAHDYVFVYATNKDALPPVGLRTAPERFVNRDDDPRGPWKAEHKGAATRRESTDFDTFVPPYRWALLDGHLPAGAWRLSPLSGVIFGERLEEAGEFPITVEVSDAEGKTVRKSLVLRVEPAGPPPSLVEVPWVFDENRGGGRLGIATDELPVGVVGEAYSAVILAAGGTTFRDEPKRPSKPRYWEYSKSTLAVAYAQDCVDFGAKGDSIPKIKRYLRDIGEVTVINQTTWWPGRSGKEVFAGFTQDATRHLKAMAKAGLTKRAPATAKPEHLIARLLDIFTAEGDLVIEVGGDSGDLSAVATKRGRRWVALRGNDDRSVEFTEECVVPRLVAVVSGGERQAAASDGVPLALPYDGGGRFNVASLGPWLARRDRDDDLVVLNPDLDDAALAEAVLTASGFLPVDTGDLVHGVEPYGSGVSVFLRPSEFLGSELLAEIVSEVRPAVDRRMTIFYFRADDDLDIAALPFFVNCRRVPYEMAL